jgi:hypothetical protein
VNVDPLVDETGQPYPYTGDDPVNGVDPSGLISAGTICGEDGPNSAACRGALQIQTQVGKEVAANQVESNKPTPGLFGTIGICGTLSIGFGLFGSVSGCVALVGGHPTLIGTVGGGGASPTGSATLGLLISNANRPSDLRGPFGFAGGSADLGLSVGGGGAVGNGSCNQGIWEGEGNVGIGLDLPIPFETHGGASYTWTWTP